MGRRNLKPSKETLLKTASSKQIVSKTRINRRNIKQTPSKEAATKTSTGRHVKQTPSK